MKKFCFLLLNVAFTLYAFAAQPLSQAFPTEYEQLVSAVYTTTHSQEELEPLFEKTISVSQEKYEGQEQLTLLAMCSFMRGMYYYFNNDEKTAGDYFDIAQNTMNAARSIEKTALNTALLAQIIMQNAAVKGFGYQIANVPGLPKLIREALTLDENCIHALYMKNFFNCTVPAPYGEGYLKGAEAMIQLLESGRTVTEHERYNMTAIIAYAYSKKNRRDLAIEYYQKALQIYPTNKEVLTALAALKP